MDLFEKKDSLIEEETMLEVEQTTFEVERTNEEAEEEEKKSTKSKKVNKEQKKTTTCKILHYNKCTKSLDLNLNGYGIRVNDVEVNGDTVEVEYIGEIGKPNYVICAVR